MSVTALLDTIAFDEQGLVPAIAQQFDTGEVLMLAWVNRAAIEATARSGQAHYWSRSRQRLWHKGESSGQIQRVVDLRLDCDGDTLLFVVDQTGVACHTGRRNCFFRRLGPGGLETIAPVETDPSTLYRDA